MVDLAALTEVFIKDEWPKSAAEIDADSTALAALHSPDIERSIRLEKMAVWISYYKVHRIKSITSSGIASKLLDYADHCLLPSSSLTLEQIKQEFQKLNEALVFGLALRDANGKTRNIDSLTSKALWCCYPGDVPILDKFAENSLRVLTRLRQVHLTPGGSRFDTYADAWFVLYNEVKPVIDKYLEDYPYKVRVLDRLLWWLGQDSFPESSASEAAC